MRVDVDYNRMDGTGRVLLNCLGSKDSLRSLESEGVVLADGVEGLLENEEFRPIQAKLQFAPVHTCRGALFDPDKLVCIPPKS